MKITKQGVPPAERKWIGKCNNCGSEAEAMKAELTHITHDQRDGSFSWEICPVCKAGDPKTGFGGMCFHPAHR